MNANVQDPYGPDINIAVPMMRTIWTLYGITLIVVLLRLYTQWRITRSPGLGDVMMGLSLLTGTGALIAMTISSHYGLGRHSAYLNPHQKVQALKFNFIGQPLGIMAAAFGRNATCVMMLQLFGTTKTRRYTLWATFWQSLIVNVVTIVLIFVQCHDVNTIWDPIDHPGYCWSPTIQEYTGFVQGAINSATDLFLTVLPIRIFYTLKMSIQMKFGLGFLLGLSVFAFVASVIKTVELQAIGERADFTFGTVRFFTWVVVEFTVVDIAASVPLILPLFSKIRKPSPKNSYQLYRPYGGNSIVILGGKSAHPSARCTRGKSKSRTAIDDPATAGYNSSEENILALQDSSVEEGMEEKGEGGGVTHAKKVIVKHTTFDVSYNFHEGERTNADGTRMRGDMWMTKELPKIPWEAQVKDTRPSK